MTTPKDQPRKVASGVVLKEASFQGFKDVPELYGATGVAKGNSGDYASPTPVVQPMKGVPNQSRRSFE